MTFIDSKGRIFGKVNIIDLLVVVLIVTAAYGFWHTHVGSKQLAALRGKTGPVEVTFLVANVRPATVNAIKSGDRVNDSKTNTYLGEVTAVRAEPAEIAVTGPDGRIYESTSQIRKDVWVTIVGPGRVSPNVITLGSTEVRIGAQIALKSNIFAVQSTVMAIKLPE
ncbi:MAG: DUF4330 domain-containing protein [Firmicutes bacterium]|nr:DUF4330 domain-containing protein [Bacillota bacterium]